MTKKKTFALSSEDKSLTGKPGLLKLLEPASPIGEPIGLKTAKLDKPGLSVGVIDEPTSLKTAKPDKPRQSVGVTGEHIQTFVNIGETSDTATHTEKNSKSATHKEGKDSHTAANKRKISHTGTHTDKPSRKISSSAVHKDKTSHTDIHIDKPSRKISSSAAHKDKTSHTDIHTDKPSRKISSSAAHQDKASHTDIHTDKPSRKISSSAAHQDKASHTDIHTGKPSKNTGFPTLSGLFHPISRDQPFSSIEDQKRKEEGQTPPTRRRKMATADEARMSSIYSGFTDDGFSGSPTSRLDNFSALMARQRTSGFVNPAFVNEEDDDDSVENDADCRSESDTDVDLSDRSEPSSTGFEGPPIYDDPVPNGRLASHGRDFKVDFASMKEKKEPPPAPKPARPKEKRAWDRFTTKAKDNFSSEDKQFWGMVFVVTKIIVAIVLFLLTLVTAVVSKICFVIISANMLPPAFTNSSFYKLKTANMTLTYPEIKDMNNKQMLGATNVLWIWAMITCIGAPYFFTFGRNFWRIWVQLGGRGSPACSTILLVLLIETIHTIGLCITVFVVVPNMDPISGLLITLCMGVVLLIETIHIIGLCITVFVVVPNMDPISGLLITLCMGVVPGFLKVVYPTVEKSELQGSFLRYTVGNIVNFVGAVGQLLALAAWCYHVYVSFGEKFDNIGYFVCVILAPILTSIHWWENFVREGSQDAKFLPLLAKHIRKSRTMLTFYASIWKMILIILIPMAIFGASCEHGSDCVNVLFFKKKSANVNTHIVDTNLVSDKFFGECNSHLPIVIAAIGALCSGVSFKLGKMACKIMTQVVDYSLPLVLSTPATIGVILGMYGGFLTAHDSTTATVGCTIPFPIWTTSGDFFTSYTTEYKSLLSVIAGLLGFLTLLIITSYIWYPGTERLQRTDKLFVQPLYCGVMTDISLMLNRRRIEKVKVSDSVKTKVNKQKIFDDETENIQVNLQDKSVFTDPDTPIIYMCATMWHETENEMTQILKSVFRMDEDQCTRKNAQYLLNRKDPDYYEFEAHIFFDDAFEKHNDDQYDFKVNEYVKLLVKTVQFSASAIIGPNYKIRPPAKMGTPYGGRLTWTLPGGNKLIAHLKDKTVIRHRKRWSQVMYMYYFLAYHLFKDETKPKKVLKKRAVNTFLLALDGDVDFYPNAVQLLVDRMKKNPDVGAACGRIHPIGNGAMVWYQKFEYAVSHWLQKAAEDKLGCVLCSPGCFSLFRGSALMDENVMNKYTTPPSEPRHHVQYDQGEDRWLCTLLLQQGHRVEYCAASDALTYAPEGFYEFFNQRRRWMPSTMANIMDLLTDWKNVTEKNPEISLLYVFYQGLLMVSSILTPGTIFLMILGAIDMAYKDLDLWWALVLNGVPVAAMVILCFVANEQKQLTYAAILSTLYSLVMMIVIVGLLVQAAEYGICSVTTVFISFVGGVFVLSALIHPQEFWCIIHGFLYFLAIPSMSMILMIYSLGNLHVVSWGTRENVSVADKADGKKKKQGKISGFLHSIGQHLPWSSGGNANNLEDDNLRAILDRLDGIETQIVRMSEGGSSRWSDRNSLIHRGGSPSSRLERGPPAYIAGQGTGERFSDMDNIISGAGERENPMYRPEKPIPRDRLVDPYWMEDDDFTFNACKQEMLDREEVKFWEELIEEYLKPIEANKAKQEQMAADLIELRNKVCLIFILINSLFIIIVFTLQQVVSTGNLSLPLPCADPNSSAEKKKGQSIEPISVAFTLVFGLLLLVQFLCMLMHRMATLLHICASTEIFKKKGKIIRHGLEEGVEAGETDGNFSQEEFSYDQVYEMVRDMQKDQDADSMSITSESSYAQSDVDDEEFDNRRKEEAKARWKRIAQRRSRVTHNTLHHNFMKNVDTFNRVLSEKKDESIQDDEDEEKYVEKIKKETNFNRMRNKSLHVLAGMSRDKSMREQLAKRKARANFRSAIHQVMGPRKITDVVKAAQLANEREKIRSEEMEMKIRSGEIAEEFDLDETGIKVVADSGDIDSDADVDSLRAHADTGRDDSNSTARSLTEEELTIHTPKVDDDDAEWPDEEDYVFQGQTSGGAGQRDSRL